MTHLADMEEAFDALFKLNERAVIDDPYYPAVTLSPIDLFFDLFHGFGFNCLMLTETRSFRGRSR
jgi:hypothetical protein